MAQNNVICVFFHLHDESEINEQHRALFFCFFFLTDAIAWLYENVFLLMNM